MYRSFGLLEVVGIATAATCIDAMVKSAYVEVYHIKRIGSGMITIIISGDLASVKEALKTGEDIANSMGELVAVRAIARPYDGLEEALLAPEEKGGKK